MAVASVSGPTVPPTPRRPRAPASRVRGEAVVVRRHQREASPVNPPVGVNLGDGQFRALDDRAGRAGRATRLRHDDADANRFAGGGGGLRARGEEQERGKQEGYPRSPARVSPHPSAEDLPPGNSSGLEKRRNAPSPGWMPKRAGG